MFLLGKMNTSGYYRSFRTIYPFVREASTSKKLILYGDEISPPVRFVMMTASMLNIDYTFHKIDLFKSENKSDFYKKINPLQKVPALSVDGEIICDSHAIALYLCRLSKYQKLYPSDDLMKAAVDRMLYFNATNLFPIDSFIFTEYFAGKKSISNEKVIEWHSSLIYIDDKLNKHRWLAGEEMWLCDICCGATISSLELLIPGVEKYVALQSWMQRLQKLPCFKINYSGLMKLNNYVKLIDS
ncbi:glutathione S-transferase 1-like isoform X1 [Manduca sexta]|uniref:glutathione S-transferase 1-like isoform X1 n=2 Tax=Manduca sexta TaxID=7130 RepID=UPI00188FCF8D|nr:glutathione S-transferase 1-like isoform X1 [Manduca sexta]